MSGLGKNVHYKYCEFLKVSGLRTVDCINLKEQIKWQVQNQYLKEYVKNLGIDGRRGDIRDNLTMMTTGGLTIVEVLIEKKL